MIEIRYRPLDQWPGEETARRRRATFSAGWGVTLEQLLRELRHLRASNVLFLVDVPASDFRIRDGHPKSNARWGHPGVVLSFDSIHGPLKYACDTFDRFDDNVRAVALGLEALRRVERYGITKRGEQYKGWSQLGSGTVMGAQMTAEEAWRVLIDLAGERLDAWGGTQPSGHPDDIDRLYKLAAKLNHPDHGGDGDLMARATTAREVLMEAAE